jgi:hypothetical protein
MTYDCGDCEKEDCQQCCPHDETDHGVCMMCEKDLTDVLANRAHEISEGMER